MMAPARWQTMKVRAHQPDLYACAWARGLVSDHEVWRWLCAATTASSPARAQRASAERRQCAPVQLGPALSLIVRQHHSAFAVIGGSLRRLAAHCSTQLESPSCVSVSLFMEIGLQFAIRAVCAACGAVCKFYRDAHALSLLFESVSVC